MSKYSRKIDLSNANSVDSKVINLVGNNKKVLEFGCADGNMSKVLKEKCRCEVVGLEINTQDAEMAKAYCKEVIIGDIEDLEWCKELSGAKFDVAIFADILEHLKSPERLLRTATAALKDDGYIIISVPNIAHVSIRLALLLGSFEYEELGILDNSHLKHFTLKNLINLIEGANFYVDSVDFVSKDIPEQIIKDTLRLLDLTPTENTMNYFKNVEVIACQFVIKALKRMPVGYVSYQRKAFKKSEEYAGELFQDHTKQILQPDTLLRQKDRLIDEQAQERTYLNSKFTLARTEIAELRNSLTWKLARSVLDPLDKIVSFWKKSVLKRTLGFDLSNPKNDNERYQEWIQKFDTLTDEDREEIRKHIDLLKYKPLISIVMPQYNCPEKWLRICLDSVCNQLYPHWELCIADDASTEPHCRNVLEEYMRKNKRIKVVFRKKNGHIVRASNSALKLVTGEFVALLDHDDKLPEHALYMVAMELNNYPDADLIYTDEDKINSDEKRYEPCFKSDWNPDLLLSCNYIGHLGIYRTSLIKEIGGFGLEYNGAQDYDLVLRFIQKTTPDRTRHIPHILYHWRAIPDSVAALENQKDYANDPGRRALQGHLKRSQVNAKVIGAGSPFYHRVVYALPKKAPMVSIIVPSTCKPRNLKWCIDVLNKTNYPNFEYVLVPNNVKAKSRLEHVEKLKEDNKIRVIPYEKPFNFSNIYNSVVLQTEGEIIGILNDDLIAVSDDWLNEMVSHALRPEVGAVGAMLYYPNETIQHAGVLLGFGSGVGHAHRHLPRNDKGYFRRAGLIQNFSAVTGACLVMKRSVFEEVGGFDPKIAIAFGDIDLCMRIVSKGYRILWTPYAEFYHMESATRGPNDTLVQGNRSRSEFEYMQAKWGRRLMWDPFYSPNLTLDYEQFAIAFPPRTVKPWKQDEP